MAKTPGSSPINGEKGSQAGAAGLTVFNLKGIEENASLGNSNTGNSTMLPNSEIMRLLKSVNLSVSDTSIADIPKQLRLSFANSALLISATSPVIENKFPNSNMQVLSIGEAPSTKSVYQPITGPSERGVSSTKIADSPMNTKIAASSIKSWATRALVVSSLATLLVTGLHANIYGSDIGMQQKNPFATTELLVLKGDQNAFKELTKQAQEGNINAIMAAIDLKSQGVEKVDTLLRNLDLKPCVERSKGDARNIVKILNFLVVYFNHDQAKKISNKLDITPFKQPNEENIMILDSLAINGNNKQAQRELHLYEVDEFIQKAQKMDKDAFDVLEFLVNNYHNEKAIMGLRNLKVDEFLKDAEKGDIDALDTAHVLGRFYNNKQASKGLSLMDGRIYISQAQDENNYMRLKYIDAVHTLLENNNKSVAEKLIDLTIKDKWDAAPNILSDACNKIVRQLRAAHLDEGISDKELKNRLTERSFNNPFMLYRLYCSRENFSILSKMIMGSIKKQAGDKGQDVLSFLKDINPKGVFWNDFVLQTANFNQLNDLITSEESLPIVLNTVFRDISSKDISSYGIRIALFTDVVLQDKDFPYQNDFQSYLYARYIQAPSEQHRRLAAALLSVYKDKLNSIPAEKIKEIEQKENIQE